MTYLLLQTFLLLLASYFVGAFVACMVKRTFFAAAEDQGVHVLVPAHADAAVPPVMAPPQPVRMRPAQTAFQPVAPRAIDPVQPKIEVLRRPEPRPAPIVLDPYRFERALIGPDANEGVPRISVVEVRPSVLKPVTGMYVPKPPPPPEPPPALPVAEETIGDTESAVSEETEHVHREKALEEKTEPRPGGLAARLRDATTAAAAGAVAAAKAAAAASVAFPMMGASRRSQVEEVAATKESKSSAESYGEEAAPVSSANLESERTSPADYSEEDITDVVPELEEDTSEHSAEEPDFSADEAAIGSEPQSDPEPVAQPPPKPKTESAPNPVLPATLVEGGDDFQRIRAIDAAIEQQLKSRGIIYFEHVAGWSAADVRRIGQELEIPGRIEREQWVEQAQILAKGGETYYSRNRKAMLKANAEAASTAGGESSPTAGAPNNSERAGPASPQLPAGTALQREPLTGVAAASQGRSVAEMAAAAAAAIAASSASVTRGLKPIEPISPLSKVDPKISMPARITDAIREKEAATATVEIVQEEPASEPSHGGDADDLKRIRGIGVLIEKRLNAMGIQQYDQIANWTSGDIDRVSRMLEFKGRIERESWVEQARILASGGQTEFSRRVDRGEVDTSRET
jgi:predicted flap endonuclease-1-like 5' DNA nuclease